MGWLVLKRKMGETINIGGSIVLVNRIRGNEVSIGVLAPDDVKILRGELSDDPLDDLYQDDGNPVGRQ